MQSEIETLLRNLDMLETYSNAIREALDDGKIDEHFARKLNGTIEAVESTFDYLCE